MIKPNELRRDNLLYQKSRGINIQIDNPNGLHHIRAWGVDYPIEDFEPIPLTPEWLERFGFQWENGYMKISLRYAKMKLGFYAGATDKMSLFQTSIPGEGSIEKEIGFGENHPEYVHQLQNLYFALTGEELTIKETV